MIEVVTGLPGLGKTANVTKRALDAMYRGKTVYSNIRIKGAIFVSDPRTLLGKVENALIIFDEMGIIFDQLTMHNIPHDVWIELRQHRKDGVDILGTAQSILDIAYPMRRLIQFEYNIFMKFWRFSIVHVRTPQARGQDFGKRVWFLSKKVFSAYDTNQKVLQDDDVEDKVLIYASMQRNLFISAHKKSQFSKMEYID
ncbi:MAG: zonular occludens toxin domain-containing protein [Turicibacter sp.]